MATPESQQTWVPYEPTRDCSLSQCSIYCPQWCSVYFTPPPPSIFGDDSSSNAPTLSPLVIALIAILVSAFLLISYYTIISRYCGVSTSFRRRLGNSGTGDGPAGQSRGLDEWQAFPSDGLDESLISRIVVCKYKKGAGFVDSPDCSVCLSEFRNDESLRLLPNCCHAFHIQCIDTWLKSHSNCPICRTNIVPVNLPPPAPVQPSPTPRDSPVVISVDEPVASTEAGLSKEGGSSVVEVAGAKDNGNSRQLSMNSLRLGKVSADDLLPKRVVDAVIAAMESRLREGASSSRRDPEEDREIKSENRAPDSITNPDSMRRSPSNDRFSGNKNGRENNSDLPV